MKYLGVDIGGTAVKMGIVHEDGKISHIRSYDVAFDQYETPILQTVLLSISFFLEEIQCKPTELSGIGVSATGQVNTHTGCIIGVGGNIKNWEGVEIKKELEEKFGCRTTVVNDANCVALGEQWIGNAKNCKNVIAITIGTGVGGGIIVDSNILLGGIGIAGELGHFSIDRNGIVCTCGNRGCYERYASMTALIKKVKQKISNGKMVIEKDLPINGETIFQLIENGNEVMIEVVDLWIEDIAAGLISLTHIFNPEKILIGGGVSVQKLLFITKVREKVMAGVMNKFRGNLKIEAAALGNQAGMAGAVFYCMNH